MSQDSEMRMKRDRGTDLNTGKISPFKRLRAALCHHCPLCRHARKNPDSVVGRVLHHKHHAENCPLWKAEKEIYGKNKNASPTDVKTLLLWKAF